jgi:integrase
MKTRFYLKKVEGQKERLIYFIFTINNKRLRFSSGIRITENLWLNGYPKIKNETSSIRKQLEYYRNEIDTFILDEVRKDNLSKDVLQRFIDKTIKGINNETRTIDYYISLYLESIKCDVQPLTYHIKELHLQYFREGLRMNFNLNDFSVEVMQHFRNRLSSDKSIKNNSTKNIYIKNVKSFINWLNYNRYIEVNYNIFLKKFNTVVNDVVYLTKDELKIIEQTKHILRPTLLKSMDTFLFSCYTSLSYSDVKKLDIKRDMLEMNSRLKYKMIKIYREKTNRPLMIPINNNCERILINNNYKLRCLTNVMMNRHIKEGLRLLGITRLVKIQIIENNNVMVKTKEICDVVGFHTGRRTAISLSIKAGVSIPLLMRITGHSDIKTLNQYIGVSGSDVFEEFSKFEI